MESKRAPKSFRISFETLFDRDKVELKDRTRVESMTDVHNKLLDGQTVPLALLYDYCVNLWSFVEFVRANRSLTTTVPLDFLVKGISCNVYWWEVLMATNHLADRVASDTPKSETKARLESFRWSRKAMGLLYKFKAEGLPAWIDRGPTPAFATEVKKQTEIADTLHTALWMRVLTMGAQEIDKDTTTAHQAAQMYATIFEVTGTRDSAILAAGLLAESLHLHHIGEYGNAIALAEAYERVLKDASHPHLSEWKKTNASTWHVNVPSSLDAATALMKTGKSRVYEKGHVPEKVILFATKG